MKGELSANPAMGKMRKGYSKKGFNAGKLLGMQRS